MAAWIGNPAWLASAGVGWRLRFSPVWLGGIYQHTLDTDFLREIQPGLHAFAQCWFTAEHDRDLDGFPEWDHPMQTGLERIAPPSLSGRLADKGRKSPQNKNPGSFGAVMS